MTCEEGAKPHRISRGGAHEAAMAEDAQIDDGVFLGKLPDQEGQKPDRREHAKDADFGRGEPVLVAALIQHDLERADPEDQKPKPDLVNLGRTLRVGLSAQADRAEASRRPPRSAP